MTKSLLNRLPDILATAAVRASEALHALGHTTTRGAATLLAPTPADSFRFTTRIAHRQLFRVDHDLPALLGWIAGKDQQASLRHQAGFLWLQAAPSQAASTDAPVNQLASDHAALSDLALRLLLARELLSPSAWLAVTPAAGLEASLPFLMSTVMGQPAIHLRNTSTACSGKGVWVCPTGAAPSPAAVRRMACLPLAHLLRESTPKGRAAIALRAGSDLAGVLPAWPALWLMSDPHYWALSELRASLPGRTPSRHPTRSTPDSFETPLAWG